jgi:nitroimidazol reductase NimA-like FMN-containing flavoprotein (pyridoxamine 5'-phosphate oxidase superfamily)
VQERNIWLATVRGDGRPHLVPIWYVLVDERVYICTQPGSVKARNLQANPRCTFSLEDGDNAVVIEGIAGVVQPTDTVVAAFQAKFEWDIRTDSEYALVFEITPVRRLMG